MLYVLFIVVYFFCAGVLFSEMLEQADLEGSCWWPITGCLILSVLWFPLLIWWLINLFCPTTKDWYIKLAETIFEDTNETEYSFSFKMKK